MGFARLRALASAPMGMTLISTVVLLVGLPFAGFAISLIAGPDRDAVIQAFGSVLAGSLAVVGAGIGAWALLRQSNTQRAIALQRDRQRERATLNAMSAALTSLLASFDTRAQAKAVALDVNLTMLPQADLSAFRVSVPEILTTYFQYGVELPLDVAQRHWEFVAYVNSTNAYISELTEKRRGIGALRNDGEEIARRYEEAFQLVTRLALDITRSLGKLNS